MSYSSAWPTATPAPTAKSAMNPRPFKRRRVRSPRQVIADQSAVNQAEINCEINSGNDVFSCFPTADTVIPQHQWATFVWNSRRPELTQTNLVDIFLFRADSDQQVLHFVNHSNPTNQSGHVNAQVNDTWFGSTGLNWNGSNASLPFYWVIIRSDNTLDGDQIRQPVFTAVQTTVLDSVAASSSLAAVASSSSALAASLSSLSAASHAPSSSGQPNASGAVQHASSSGAFPHWAIAVIVVLGFLAIAATCILAFLILRRIRRKQQSDLDSHRNSVGSASPMIAHDKDKDGTLAQRYDYPTSPLLPPPNLAAVVSASPTAARPTSHDAASSISDGGGPFSTADAVVMADVFRNILRKPDFESDLDNQEEENTTHPVLRTELLEEGRDIRNVGSSRGVKVESLPDP